jgi:hypothetical protein
MRRLTPCFRTFAKIDTKKYRMKKSGLNHRLKRLGESAFYFRGVFFFTSEK